MKTWKPAGWCGVGGALLGLSMLYIYSLSALTPTAESARTPEISARR